MKLSIITCTYNSGKFLKQTLDSIASQNIGPSHSLESIILDAFSTDETLEIAKKFQEEMKGRIKVCIESRPPRGIFNAFNEGVKASTGDYVMILPSDDFLEPDVLGKYLEFIVSTGELDLYYARRNTYHNELGQNIGTPYPNKKIYYHGLNKYILGLSCYISHPAMILRRDVHDRYGYYREDLKLVADWDFYLMLCQHRITSRHYPEVVSSFRIHEGSATTGDKNPLSLALSEENQVFHKYFGILAPIYIGLRKLLRIYFRFHPLGK